MFKQKELSVASVYVTSNCSYGVVVTNRNGRFTIDNIETAAHNDPDDDLIGKNKVERLAIVVGPEHSLFFALNNFQPQSLPIHYAANGINEEQQYIDYILNDDNGYLATLNKETADYLIAQFKRYYPQVKEFAVINAIAGAHYIYTRAYQPSTDTRTALLHVSESHIVLTLLQGNAPKSTNFFPIGDSIDATCAEIVGQIQDSAYKVFRQIQTTSISVTTITGRDEKVGNSNESMGLKLANASVETVLLYGECDREYLDQLIDKLKLTFRHVDALTPFINDLFELPNIEQDNRYLTEPKRLELEKNAHKYLAPVAIAGLMLEGAGMNLSNTDIELWREFPKERSFSQEMDNQSELAAALVEGSKRFAQWALPMVKAQRTVLILAVLIGIGMIGYKYGSLQRQEGLVAQDKARESSRAAQLADVRKQHELYKQQIAIIDERIKAINTIRSEQLTVKTVFDRLDERIPAGLVFTDMEVNNRELRINGYAPDRLAVMAFATRLGNSAGIFSEVYPIYDDKNNTGNYQISCKYVGPVEINPIPVPAVSNIITRIKESGKP